MNQDDPAHIHILFEHAFNAGDIEALVALYESNAVLVVNGQPVAGQQSIRAAYERMLARRSAVKFNGSLAVLHGDRVLEPAPGETGNTARGLSTEVVRRQPDGSWRFVIDNPHTPR
jgi:uncharacterized protein (TIGR02246 family)